MFCDIMKCKKIYKSARMGKEDLSEITVWHHEAVINYCDHEGRIFQSNPHTNNSFIILLIIKNKNFIFKKKDSQKFPHILRCYMT